MVLQRRVKKCEGDGAPEACRVVGERVGRYEAQHHVHDAQVVKEVHQARLLRHIALQPRLRGEDRRAVV